MRDLTPDPGTLDPIELAPREQLRRVHASSGTTGQPTVVRDTDRDLATWADVMARSIRAAGGRPGQLLHNACGYGLFAGGLGAHAGAERLGCTVVPVSGGQTERQVRRITDLRPDIIKVTPWYMPALLDEFERQGLDARASSLQVGIFGAEPWAEDMRREVEERSDMHAADIYGLSEVIRPRRRVRVRRDQGRPPETGLVLPDGEHGELVLTSLTKEAMPILRYRTRDLTRLLPGTARTRRIEKISGRSDDMRVRGVDVVPSARFFQITSVTRMCVTP